MRDLCHMNRLWTVTFKSKDMSLILPKSDKLLPALRQNQWLLLVTGTAALLLLALNLVAGKNNSSKLEKLALSSYEQPEFQPLPAVPENEAMQLIRSAFIQQRWESAFYDIARMPADSKDISEARYVAAHIHFLKKDYKKAGPLFDQVIYAKDLWYSPRALWYKSLCDLAQGEKGKALTRIKFIASASGHPQHREAQVLLNKLN